MIGKISTRLFFSICIALVLAYGCSKKTQSSGHLLTKNSSTGKSDWQTTDSEKLGFDTQALRDTVIKAESMHNLYALLVVRDGKIVVERYFGGTHADQLFHLRSVTKNFTSALTGISIEKGTIPDVEQSIAGYFPDLAKNGKEKIQIKHLLNMSTGIEWEERKEIMPLVMNRVPTPIAYMLKKPLVDKPGEKMRYNSIASHMLGRILEKENKVALHELAEAELFKPLGIENYAWEKDPNFHTWGGYGLQLRARDLAKFGQLYLQNGKWKGKQVVPESWVKASAQKQIDTGVPGGGYSNQWWYAGKEHYKEPLYYGQGYGGQGLVIVPEKKMVVVIFHKHDVPSKIADQQWDNMVESIFKPIYNAAK